MSSRLDARKETFKKTDTKAGFDRRFEATTKLRKGAVQERATKKRQISEEPGDAAPVMLAAPGSLTAIVDSLRSPIPNVQTEAAETIRRMLSVDRDPPINAVTAAGAVPLLIAMLGNHANPRGQFEACWALTNIASGTTEDAHYVAKEGAIPQLMQLLHSPNGDVREQAMWALGNLAGDGPSLRDYLLRCDILTPVLQEMQVSEQDPNAVSFMRTAAWTLSNLCRGKPVPRVDEVRPALRMLARGLWHPDLEILTDACWAFSYISEAKDGHVQLLLELNIIPRIVELLLHAKPVVQTAALRVVGNVVTGDEAPTQAVLNSRALFPLQALLNHPRKAIVKEACWTISNIMAGTDAQIQAVIDEGIVPMLVECMNTTKELVIRKEACWAISNASTGGTDRQKMYLVSAGVVPPLCRMLEVKDPRAVVVALEALRNLLEAGATAVAGTTAENPVMVQIQTSGGADMLEDLQDHPDATLSHTAQDIVDKYFEAEEEDEDDHVAPAAGSSQFQFGYQGQNGAFQF
jgi:hypothetical protein